MEVYLPEQVLVLFENGQARVISHVSSGAGVEWCDVVEIDLDDGTTEEKGICGISITPGGVYHFERKVDGWRNAKLGRLYQPVYFNYGIAIHGAGNVPAYPASRGCVRHPMHIAEYLPDLIDINDMIYVFDGVEEPETYGAQPSLRLPRSELGAPDHDNDHHHHDHRAAHDHRPSDDDTANADCAAGAGCCGPLYDVRPWRLTPDSTRRRPRRGAISAPRRSPTNRRGRSRCLRPRRLNAPRYRAGANAADGWRCRPPTSSTPPSLRPRSSG